MVDGEIKTVKVAEDATINGNSTLTSAQVKDKAAGLFKSYSTSKGLITRLTAYNDYDGTDKEGFLQGVDIDKTSKEYTVTLNTAGKLTLKNGTTDTTNRKNEIVTVDKDAKSFYVNTDDEISVSSYNAIAKDENDVVYAVIKDYMVKTLIVYEQDGNDANPVKPELSKDVEVKSVDIDTPDTTITYYVEAGAKTLTTSDIKAILADKGCKDITKSGATWSFTYDGMTFEGVTVVTTQVYALTVKNELPDNYKDAKVSCDSKFVAKGDTVVVTVTDVETWTNANNVKVTGTAIDGSVTADLLKDSKGATYTFKIGTLTADATVTVEKA